MIATPSAKPRTRARASDRACWAKLLSRSRECGGERAADREDSGDRGEGELPAGVGAHAGVQREGCGCGQEERVPARRGPGQRHRGDPGRAHHARTLQRRAGAGKRYVQGNQKEEGRSAYQRAGAHQREQRHSQCHQEHHVLAAHRQEVAEAGVAPVLAGGLVDRLVLAEHHAASEGGLGRRKTRRDGALRPPAHGIERAGYAATAAAGRVRPVEQELAGYAGMAELIGEARAVGPERPDLPIGGELGADVEAGRQACPASDAHQQPDAARAGRTPRPPPRMRRRGWAGALRGGGRGGSAPRCVSHPRNRCFDCPQPRLSNGSTEEHHRHGHHGQAESQVVNRCAECDRHRHRHRRSCGRGEQPGREPSHRDVGGCCLPHGCSASRSVARRFSPMPSTCASSSIEPKPPWASRYSMIRFASVGPMPSTSSSCSGVALERCDLPSGGVGGQAPLRGHHDLLAVLNLRGEIHEGHVGARKRPSRLAPVRYATRVSGRTRIRPGALTAPATCT